MCCLSRFFITIFIVCWSQKFINAVQIPCDEYEWSTSPPEIIFKEFWTSIVSNNLSPNTRRPLKYVTIYTVGDAFCITRRTCEVVLRELQFHHMQKNNWSDIGYNYMIGGDDRIYEGQGWFRSGEVLSTFAEESLSIAFLHAYAEYGDIPLNTRMTLSSLLHYGVCKNHLDRNYTLIVSAQVLATDFDSYYNEIRSPYSYAIYNSIKKMEHWRNVIIYPRYNDDRKN